MIKITETKRRLINVMEKLPAYVYEEEEDLKIIIQIAKKYYQVYQDEELKTYVEDYIKYEKEMRDDKWKEKRK